MIERLRRRRRILYFGGLCVGGVLFMQQLWHGIQGLLQREVGSTQILAVAIAAGMIGFAYLLQMLAWTVILRGLGRWIRVRAVLSGYVLSFLPRYIPGSVWGYLGRGEWLKSSYGVPYATSALSSLLEVGMGLLTALVVAIGCYTFSVWPLWAGGLAVLLAALAPWLSWRVYGVVRQLPLTKKLDRLNILSAPDADIGFGHWLLSYLIYLVFWFCYGAALSLLVEGLTDRPAGLLQPTFAYTLAWVVGFLVLVVPAGLGVREAVLSTLLVWQLSLNTQSAGGVSVACRIVVYLAEMAWLLVGLVLSRTMTGKNHAPDRVVEPAWRDTDSAH